MIIAVRSFFDERMTAWLSQFLNWNKPEKLLIFSEYKMSDVQAGIIRILEKLGWYVQIVNVSGNSLAQKTGQMWRVLSKFDEDILFVDDDWFFSEDDIRQAVYLASSESIKSFVFVEQIVKKDGGYHVIPFEGHIKVPMPSAGLWLSSGKLIDERLYEPLLNSEWDMSDWVILCRWYWNKFGNIVFIHAKNVYHLHEHTTRHYRLDLDKFHELMDELEAEFDNKDVEEKFKLIYVGW